MIIRPAEGRSNQRVQTVANVQRYFDAFHKNIRLSLMENRTLRQKRDIVCSKLVDRLPQIFEAAGEECPSFEFRDQGSYQMQTGTFPLNSDFDIDLGMYFEIDPDDYHPLELKRMVFKALEGHTREVRIRRPCVTVQYQQAGEPSYHVDIAIYSDGSQSDDGMPRLAIGKGRSGEKFCGWKVSDPLTLSSEILGSYEGAELTQFRRLVRYLKRWKDMRFPPTGNGAPRGVALTVACHQHFDAAFFRDDTPDDVTALTHVVRGIMESFTLHSLTWIFGGPSHELEIRLPVEPYSDLCERMTPRHVKRFYEELESLLEVLEAVKSGRSEEKACKRLRGVFGPDFPLPA